MDFESLKSWFILEKRDFPWRRDPTPYRVLVSEMMLQQTGASVVIAYFERWMARFPTLQALALAEEEEVLKMWEGLGYYARARYLRLAAKELAGGASPDHEAAWRKIKGVGPYTAAAIASFAHHRKAAAVDGNVARVLARYFCLTESNLELKKRLFALLPEQEPWVAMEALIELGALVCTKKPSCERCPLQESCQSFKEDCVERFPAAAKKTALRLLKRMVAVVRYRNLYLVQKGKGGKVMAGLYEFPYFEKEISHEEAAEKLGLKLACQRALQPTCHTFTCHKAHLSPFLYTASTCLEVEGYVWLPLERLRQLPFSSGHKRILMQL